MLDPNKEYSHSYLHLSLIKTYGNPPECQHCGIKGSLTKGRKRTKWNIVWALKTGYPYRFNKENFLHLCNKCHRSYDTSEKWNKSISRSRLKNKKWVGNNNPKSKLTKNEVNDIRILYHTGLSSSNIGKFYSVHRSTIIRIVKNRLWDATR